VDWASLGWRWDEPPIPVIYVGTPGFRRKAVVHLVEKDSRQCRAVVKVPLTDGAKLSILHEADALVTLESERFERSPRLLHVDRQRGISTQSFVEGRTGTRQLTADSWRLLESMLLPGKSTSLTEFAETLRRDIDSECQEAAEIKTLKAAVNELRDDSPLPACWEHGDFAPWNIKCSPGNGCVLFDWEDAQRNGLPLQDAFHFLHMQDCLFGGRPKLHAAEVHPAASELGVSTRLCGKLEIAYLAAGYIRCQKQGNRKRASFLLATLEMRGRGTE
jgi:hypothetical protein